MLVRIDEIAKRLGVSVRTVRRLTAAGRIPAVRVGRQLRYDLDAVLRALGDSQFRRDSDAISVLNRADP